LNPFIFHAPTRIISGEQMALSAGDFVRELKGNKVLLVTDAFLERSGMLDGIIASLT